jgi:UDP-N-acetylglucosamine--N-acetylmuramyl-(pentapeptide) pyrophosphoryl-undecaprenol N-acetylglucosamine transferase
VTQSPQSLRWVVAGGGTGGHVTPALALAERITGLGDAVLLMGSEHGLETRLVPEAGFELAALPAQQVMGRSLVGRAAAAVAMLRAVGAAWRRLGRFRADLVISVGGYASVPAVIAGWLRRIPVALIEPNAVPGRANRLAARLASRIFVHFDEAAGVFAHAQQRGDVRCLGIPLRAALIQAFGTRAPRRTPARPFRLLVFGGSQGARQINEAMIEAVATLDAASLEIFHQSGAADRERVADAYAKAGVTADVVAFTGDMPDRYAWADLAVCRSGALTVAELTMAALPALFVPYPYAADDHQTANARALAEVGAARVLDSRSLTGTGLAGEIRSLFAEPAQLASMSTAAAKLARPDAAERILDECRGLLPVPERR